MLASVVEPAMTGVALGSLGAVGVAVAPVLSVQLHVLPAVAGVLPKPGHICHHLAHRRQLGVEALVQYVCILGRGKAPQ